MGAILHLRAGTAGTSGDPMLPSSWQAIGEGELADVLRHVVTDVVVVDMSAREPIAALQRVHALAPEAAALVEIAPDDPGELRRALQYAPGLPSDLRLVSVEDDLVAAATAAQDQAIRGRRHAELIASLRHAVPERLAAAEASGLLSIGPLLEHAALGVLVTDAEGRVSTWNDTAAAMLGLDADSAGRALARLFKEPEPVAAALAHSLSSLQTVAQVHADALEGADGAFELSFSPTRAGDGRPAVLGILVDMTERRRAERARDELARRLQASARAQAFLLEAWDATAHTAGYRETLHALAGVAVPTLGDLCLIDVLDDAGRLERVAARHADPAAQHLADRLQRRSPSIENDDHPIARSIRERVSVWSPELPGAVLGRIARDEQHAELGRQLGVSGYITVPLLAGRRTLGTVTLLSCGERRFALADLHLAEALAGRVAAVVDKARLYDREHLVAVSLQRAMQTALPDLGSLAVAARYVTAREDTEVGGDWYDVFALPGGAAALVIGDVVGHDLAAATRMGQLRNLLRGLAVDRQEDPATLLGRLDRLNSALSVTAFATLVYGVLEEGRGGNARYRFVNAGHLPPILVGADGRARVLEENFGVALGAPGEHHRREACVEIPAGSTLLLYTDGLVETRRGHLGSAISALAERCAKNAGAPLDALMDEILAALPEHAEDDVAILAVRPAT